MTAISEYHKKLFISNKNCIFYIFFNKTVDFFLLWAYYNGTSQDVMFN